MSFTVHKLLYDIRLLSFVALTNDEETKNNKFNSITETLTSLEDDYIPILKRYSSVEESSHPVIVYNLDNSHLEHLNGYELMKNIIVWAKGLVNAEEWNEKINNGENVFMDYRIR